MWECRGGMIGKGKVLSKSNWFRDANVVGDGHWGPTCQCHV